MDFLLFGMIYWRAFFLNIWNYFYTINLFVINSVNPPINFWFNKNKLYITGVNLL